MCVSPANLGSVHCVLFAEKMLSAPGFAQSRRIFTSSTLIVCIGSTIGKGGAAGKDQTVYQRITAVVLNDRVDLECFYFAAVILSQFARGQAGGQVVQLVPESQFSAFEIPLVPRFQQRVIANVLSYIEICIDPLELLITKRQASKQGMTKGLLTGGVGVPVQETVA